MSALDELLAEIALVPGQPSSEGSAPRETAAGADAARAPAQIAPPSTAAATTSVETKPAAPPTGLGRVLRWPLSAAIAIAVLAIAAIVVAIVVLADGGNSSDRPGRDLSGLVLAPTAQIGDLNFKPDDSGDFNPENEILPISTQAEAAYHNVFVAKDESAKPYWFADSIAAVFEDENAAQSALAELEGQVDDETLNGEITDRPAVSLGDEAFAFHATGVQPDAGFSGSWEGSSYLYLWRTDTLLQAFYLVLSGPGVSEDTARSFADTMASRSGG